MKWMEALKDWNKEKSVHKQVWCIPKKDSPEYREVINKMKNDEVKIINKPKYVLDYENKINNLSNLYLGENAKQVKGKSRTVKSLLINSSKKEEKVNAWYEKHTLKTPKIDEHKNEDNFPIQQNILYKKKKSGILL